MIGIILVAILAILMIGLLLKIIKIAVIVALCVGIVLFAQKALGAKQSR